MVYVDAVNGRLRIVQDLAARDDSALSFPRVHSTVRCRLLRATSVKVCARHLYVMLQRKIRGPNLRVLQSYSGADLPASYKVRGYIDCSARIQLISVTVTILSYTYLQGSSTIFSAPTRGICGAHSQDWSHVAGSQTQLPIGIRN